MGKKRTAKSIVDSLMTVVLLLLMGRQITGDVAHEWLGAGIMVLWILHHFLDRNYYSHILKGRYTPARTLQMLLNTVLCLSMLGMMASGVILSRRVFAFLPIKGGIGMARSLHIFSVYWGFVLMGLHLGVHWDKMVKRVKRAAGTPGPTARWVSRAGAAAVAGYGIYAFVKRGIGSYMLRQAEFVFFDHEGSRLVFFADYMAIMGLFVCIGHFVMGSLRKKRKGR